MVKNFVTEEQVKKALKIESFRNLSKDKIMEFVSLLPNMDKDVAIAVVNQFPAYTDNAKVMVNCLKDMCRDIIEKNDTSTKEVASAYNIILNDLSTLLLRDDISYEERAYITEKMIDIADKIAIKDTENKNFLAAMNQRQTILCLGVLIVGAAILGVSTRGISFRIPQIA